MDELPRSEPAARHLIEAVADVGQRMAAAAASLEPDFLRLTGGLAKLTDNARSLAGLGGGLAQQVEQRLQNLGQAGLGALIRGSLDSLQRHLAAGEGSLQALLGHDDALAQLALIGRRMRGLATQLCVTRLGFSIETARLANEQEIAFRDFVGQLAGLEKVFARLGTSVSQTAEDARKQQTRAARSIRGGLGEFAAMANRCDHSARSASNGVEALLQSFVTCAGKVAGAVGAVRMEAEELVYFLQVGDILRQKIEHVAEALGGRVTARASLASIVRLQLAQIDAVRDEVEEARTKLGRAFAGLGEATSHLVAPILEMVELADRSGATGASFAALIADAAALRELGQRSDELGKATARAADEAATVARSIVEQLHEVSETNATMHMMALNAIVNTSRLGSSAAALNVLSVQVHEIASASGVIVAEVAPLVAKLGAGERTETVADRPVDESGMTLHLAEIEQLRAAVQDVGAQSGQLARAQRDTLAVSNRDVQFLLGLRDRLDAASVALRPLLVELGPTDEAPGEHEAATLTSYTMESERAVHRRILGTAEPVGASSGAPSTGNALGDNVELF
jgi:hypothetical protein